MDRLNEMARNVRLLVFDVDGVMTDGGMYYTESGDEFKKFNTRDGLGIRLLAEAGIHIAIVTGEDTDIVRRRAAKLKIQDVHLGIADKWPVVEAIAAKYGIQQNQIGYMGDDMGDLDAMQRVGVAFAPADCVPPIKRVAHFVAKRSGGEGAVREVCDLILAARAKSTEVSNGV